MTAPDYVPVTLADRARTGLALPPPRPWLATRPADIPRAQPVGDKLGRPGPDQGYAHLLAERFADRLLLQAGEDHHDVDAGCMGVALKRASLFGRAPVVFDLELAYGVFGFLDQPPADLVAWRRPLFAGAAHAYWGQRAVADAVPEPTLRLTPAQVRSRLSDWRSLLTAA